MKLIDKRDSKESKNLLKAFDHRFVHLLRSLAIALAQQTSFKCVHYPSIVWDEVILFICALRCVQTHLESRSCCYCCVVRLDDCCSRILFISVWAIVAEFLLFFFVRVKVNQSQDERYLHESVADACASFNELSRTSIAAPTSLHKHFYCPIFFPFARFYDLVFIHFHFTAMSCRFTGICNDGQQCCARKKKKKGMR